MDDLLTPPPAVQEGDLVELVDAAWAAGHNMRGHLGRVGIVKRVDTRYGIVDDRGRRHSAATVQFSTAHHPPLPSWLQDAGFAGDLTQRGTQALLPLHALAVRGAMPSL